MTHIYPRLTRWVDSLAALFSPTADRPVETVPGEVAQRLRRILVVVANCRGSTSQFQLLVEQMSPSSLLFLTDGDLGEGDEVEAQVLLTGFGSLRLAGRVAWMRPTERPRQFHGELRLELADHERQVVEQFLERDRSGRR